MASARVYLLLMFAATGCAEARDKKTGLTAPVPQATLEKSSAVYLNANGTAAANGAGTAVLRSAEAAAQDAFEPGQIPEFRVSPPH
jgi:hypothetical protein